MTPGYADDAIVAVTQSSPLHEELMRVRGAKAIRRVFEDLNFDSGLFRLECVNVPRNVEAVIVADNFVDTHISCPVLPVAVEQELSALRASCFVVP
jgi:hypothetical protein